MVEQEPCQAPGGGVAAIARRRRRPLDGLSPANDWRESLSDSEDGRPAERRGCGELTATPNGNRGEVLREHATFSRGTDGGHAG